MAAQEVAVIPMILLALAAPAQDHNLVPASDGLAGYWTALSEHYRMPLEDITHMRQRGIAHNEVPAILYLARQAGVPETQVTGLRLGGMRFSDITSRLGLSPEIYYVPLKATPPAQPYGKAYALYRSKAREAWRKVVLGDDDVVNLVNLRFLSLHYALPPDEVVAMRSGGKTFARINAEVRARRVNGRM